MAKLINPKYIILHHSVTSGDYQTALNIMKRQQEIYGKNSVSNTYHFIITNDGHIIPWISTEIVAGHCGVDGSIGSSTPCNYNSFGICLLGNFEKEEVPQKQYDVLLVLLKTLIKKYNIKEIIGHRDVINTTCPGSNLYKLLPKIKKEVFMDWKEDIINWALQKGLITSQDWLKNKDKPITIAELLAIIKNLTDKLKIDIGG